MKLFFIGSQLTIVHAMLYKYRATYNPKLDTFKVEAVVVPCLILALFLQRRPEGFLRIVFEVSGWERGGGGLVDCFNWALLWLLMDFVIL